MKTLNLFFSIKYAFFPLKRWHAFYSRVHLNGHNNGIVEAAGEVGQGSRTPMSKRL